MTLSTRAEKAAASAGAKPDETRRRSVEAGRLAEKRRAARDITLPPVQNAARRERGREDPEYFLRTYWREKFFNPFCVHHKAMIASLVERIIYGGRQAVAAPRSDGKSSIIEGIAGIWAIVYGLRHFPVIIGDTQDDASARLGSVMEQYETNDMLLADFPEVCYPIRQLHHSPRIGNQQTVDGSYTQVLWGSGRRTKEIRFPVIAGSAASGARLLAVGIEGKIRGLLRGADRPDLAILDDVESEDSVDSPAETRKIRRKIARAVLPMAGPNTRIAVFMPCTIIRKGCLADEFTDRQQAPAWMGLRFALIRQWPDEMDLWSQYRQMRQVAQRAGDETAREAQRFYLANREAMDAGCVASNPYRYVGDTCPDGSQLQVSTLQFAMDWIADETTKLGEEEAWSAFNAEYQNEPAASDSPQGSGCSVEAVRSALNGVPRGHCPPGTDYLTAGIDVHGYELVWSVLAWVGSAGHVIDYGSTPVNSPRAGRLLDPENVTGTEAAIRAALLEWRNWEAANGWPRAGGGGEVKHVDRVLIDSRWRPDPVYDFCAASPRPTYWPCSGDGSGKGQSRYRHPSVNKKGQRIGFHYWFARVAGRDRWLTHADGDYWKGHIHAGFVLTSSQGGLWRPDMGSSMALYGSEATVHNGFASQIMCEELKEQFVTGQGIRRWWEQRHKSNHYLDATAYACCGAAMAGVRFSAIESAPPHPRRRGVRIAGTVEKFGR